MNAELEQKLAHIPTKPGAYLMKDERGEIIYVGKAVSLRSRVRSYFQKGQAHGAKVLAMVAKIEDVEWIVTDSEVEALMLECNLIKKHRPHYNIRLRDDKHYPYLCVTTSETFPRVIITRRSKLDGNRYFGPYTDSTALRESQRLIRKVFRIRSCNKALTGTEHDRPCLNLHLGQCLSPCSGAVSPEDYGGLVQDTCQFLEGRQEKLAKRLEGAMLEAAEALEFERAARLRDQVDAIRKLVERQKAISTDHEDQDVVSLAGHNGSACVQVMFIRSGRLIGQETFFMDGIMDDGPEWALDEFLKQYYRDAAFVPSEILVSHEVPEHEVLEQWLRMKRGGAVHLVHPKRGAKKDLVHMASTNATLTAEREVERRTDAEALAAERLAELREVLDMAETPMRIEAYDISNIQGREAVGSMVVFENAAPAKAEYRRFKIRTVDQPNDFEMMREVLRRRLAGASSGDPKFAKLPDLVVIDGGKGQLGVAVEVLAEAGYDIPVIGLAKRFEEIYRPREPEPILLPTSSKALHVLQQIRDEAHRFALAYHHKLRDKKTTASVLDSIAGVGSVRRKALIKRFGSVAGVRQASLAELLQVPGMTKAAAEAVYDRFRKD